jgi:hypothetical protein
MKHVAAFQPQLTTAGLSEDEWDRLPWLCDEPRKALPRRRKGLATWAVLFLMADAFGSYAAGRVSGAYGSPGTSTSSIGGRREAASREGMGGFAQRISEARALGWHPMRPNAPY